MFKHQGQTRTYKHNLQIATVLSFVAGMVNVTGFLSIQQLTTNVTGHFALIINDLAHFQFWQGFIYCLYILSFLLGAFTSGVLIETFQQNQRLNVFVLPTLLESLILIIIPALGLFNVTISNNLIACMMLFTMGLQNSYVTKISNTTVRTTHLTGLFTDLGIELSQLFFPKTHTGREKLKSAIMLRIAIISFFFIGGLTGGYMYSTLDLKMNTLFFCAVVLLFSLFYDDLRFRISHKTNT